MNPALDTLMRTITGQPCERSLATGLADLQRTQSQFDSIQFTGGVTPSETRRHIAFHVMILAAKMARVEERADHGDSDQNILISEVIPDLLVYAAQLANLFGVSLAEAYDQRLDSVALRNRAAASSTRSDDLETSCKLNAVVK